jgi:N-methylhydantoinase A/oxoprolinase/acetone carboxylase beta subunit
VAYRIAVDIGGTFTDCVVVDEKGQRIVSKALTRHGALDEGVVETVALGARQVGMTGSELLAATELFVHGTTQATNALITRDGASVGLITTAGHEDVLSIGRVYSKIAGLTERDLVHSSRLAKPRPIVPRRLIRGVNERIDRDGDVVVELSEDEVVAAIEALVAAGVEAVAVSFLWSFVNDAHERRVASLLAEHAPGVFASVSSQVAPVLGEYERTATTAVNAYVGPKVVSYLERLDARLRADGLCHPLLVMQASGGLTSVADAARVPIVTLDSGPVGGILGCQYLGNLNDQHNVICTDVGGTSFDVGLIRAGEIPLDPDPVVAQFNLRLPKILVDSIGSGGGSIAWIDEGGLLRVGPQSAGSRPGPACYGLGGTDATVTDADLVLGYLDSGAFLGGQMPLDRHLAMKALARLGGTLGMEPEEVAVGIFTIINAQMADLIRKLTIEQGHDPRDCVLVAYGGAGPTHAVFYGSDIGSRAILVPARSTAFSAEGMLACDITHTAEVSRTRVSPLSEDDIQQIGETLGALEERLRRRFAEEGTRAEAVSYARSLGVRFRNQVQTLPVPVPDGPLSPSLAQDLPADFARRYGQVYGEGAVLVGGRIEIDLHRVVGTQAVSQPPLAARPEAEGPATPKGERPVHFGRSGFVTTQIFDGAALRPGQVVTGPAVIERMGDSVVVPPGYQATVDRYLSLRLVPVPQPGSVPQAARVPQAASASSAAAASAGAAQ